MSGRSINSRVDSKILADAGAKPVSMLPKQRASTVSIGDVDAMLGGSLFVNNDKVDPADQHNSNTVIVNGVSYPVNQQIEINPDLIVGVFTGNKRSSLKNIEELAQHIVQVGKNTEPVLLRPHPAGKGFEVVKGSRRTAGVRYARANLQPDQMLNAIVRQIDDVEATVEAAAENLHRDDLSPWERASQMDALIESGACKGVEDLLTYLPASKKAPTRTLAYYYLIPSQIPPAIRLFIDEEQEVSINRIKHLKEVLDDHSKRIDDLATHLKGFCKQNSHKVQEIERHARKFFSISSHEGQGSKSVRNIVNSDGKSIAAIEITSKGKVNIVFDKLLSENQVNELSQKLAASFEKMVFDIDV